MFSFCTYLDRREFMEVYVNEQEMVSKLLLSGLGQHPKPTSQSNAFG